MKKLSLLAPIFAAVTLVAQPAFADAAHRHEKCAHEAQGEAVEPAKKMHCQESMMQESIEKMRVQMATINQTKDTKKRQKLLQEHNKSMRDSIKMMREMMGSAAMECASGSGHKMGEHKMGEHKMGEHKMDGQKMCDHKKGDNPVSQPDVKADATPAAQANPDPITATDKTSPSAEKKLWVCPMHPDVVQDHPGTCPICGMDLEEMGQPGTSQSEHSHTMGGGMKGECMMGGGMKGDCMMGGGTKGESMMGGGMKGECMKGGGMKGECMKGGGMKGDCMMGGGMKGECMMSGGTKGECMMSGGMKGDCMMGGGMKGECMKGGGMKGDCMMGGGMKGRMTDKHMGMMLMLMEQMIEHGEASMAVRK